MITSALPCYAEIQSEEGSATMPIKNPNDAHEVHDSFDRIFVATPEGRPQEVRKLFVEVLDF